MLLWALLGVVHKVDNGFVLVSLDADDNLLLNSESDTTHINLAIRVVDLHDGTGDLVGAVDVPFELSMEGARALRDAAEIVDLRPLRLCVVSLQFDGRFADHENLLGFNFSAF